MNTVEPIRDRNQLAEIMEGLERDTSAHGRRIYLEFATMFYTGLRVSDIIRLQKKHVTGVYIKTREQKTGKLQKITIPTALKYIYQERLDGIADNAYLFPSRRKAPDGTERHITTRQVGYDMKLIQKRYNIKTPFACHSLRKTHGYMRYKFGGEPIEILRLHFNHADEATTRRYIGIDEEERNKGLRNLQAGSYRPPKPKTTNGKKRQDSATLEITRQERTENGRLWGQHKQEANRRKAENEKAERLKRKAKSEYDKARYQKRKAEAKSKA